LFSIVFAELLARSSFSFLRGASHPEELVAQAKELELSAVAICDRDGLYGAARAYSAAREVGQRFIVGAELSVDSSIRRIGSWRSAAGKRTAEHDVPTVALLVQNHEGYSNLCKLLTLAHGDLPKGEASLELEWLSTHASGLFAIVPAPRCPGDMSTPQPVLFERVKDIFGERAALAAHRHLDGFDRERLAAVRAWSERYALPIVASARPLYHHAARKPLADVMECIRRGTTLERAGTDLTANAEAFLRSEPDMRRLFRECPDWVDRAGQVAEGLGFSLSELRYRFPCTLMPGETADEKLCRLTYAGLAERYPHGTPEQVQRQVAKELELIAQLEVAPYFLSVWEIVEIARRRRILCQGRGSAANSAVCFALGVTAVDPARSNLLFERFLSAERREPPDIDVDFEHERREEVIQEIYERYGRDNAAMVCEVICYRGKSALREVGKAFGLSLDQVDRLSGTITHWDSAETSEKRLSEIGFDAQDSRLKRVVELARQLQGFPRHLSIHVGGFVLSAEPLTEVAPIEPGRMKDRTVVPWDKDDLETLGFFKVDVLGLGMLTAIRKALALIHADGGLRVPGASAEEEEAFDPLLVVTRIPPEDPAVYAMVSRADTVGVFQIESRAQMAMLPRLRPKCFYDLVIEVAIVRPGPIQGGMVHPYLRRRTGEEKVSSPHPDLWAILERTLGVPLFQEQVMQIAIEGAGYSGGEADQLRRDMAAWRKNGKLLRHRQRLLDGFVRKGIDPEFGAALFEQIKGFGDYGFPESHAASFALLVYASAWQKTHFPEYFACALLNAQPMGFYSPSSIMRDAQRHGVMVRDVDVACSDWDSTLEERVAGATSRPQKVLRLGLRLVKGLGEAVARRIVSTRKEWPFANIEDVVRRAELRKNEIEALAEAGAFASLVDQRRQALWLGRAPRVHGLFEKASWQEPSVSLPALRAAEELVLDYRRKGLSVDDHPLNHLRSKLNQRGVVKARDLAYLPRGRQVAVAGVVLCRQQPGTASGIVFITLEDETGITNLILYRQVFEQYHLAARHAAILLAYGEVERQITRPKEIEPEYDVIHVIVRKLERLDVPGRDIGRVSRDFH
jgi:error-prone DNA polymerase